MSSSLAAVARVTSAVLHPRYRLPGARSHPSPRVPGRGDAGVGCGNPFPSSASDPLLPEAASGCESRRGGGSRRFGAGPHHAQVAATFVHGSWRGPGARAAGAEGAVGRGSRSEVAEGDQTPEFPRGCCSGAGREPPRELPGITALAESRRERQVMGSGSGKGAAPPVFGERGWVGVNGHRLGRRKCKTLLPVRGRPDPYAVEPSAASACPGAPSPCAGQRKGFPG